MKPAFSVIFLTTLIGAAQGLFLALFTHQSYALFGLLPMQSDCFYGNGSAIVMLLLGGGLFAAVFHLGKPGYMITRAWRGMTQWRTSWLSRELIALPAFMGIVFLYGVTHLMLIRPEIVTLPGGQIIDLTVLLGVVGTIMAFVLFICTAMIYACLRFLREWHSPLTVINYILMGGSSGFVLAAFYATCTAPTASGFFTDWAIILTVLAFVGRVASLLRNARLKPTSTIQTAIGVKHPKITQRSMGAMGGSFNTRDFFHGRSATFLRAIKPAFLILAFVLPLALLALGPSTPALLGIVFILQYVGLLAERWFFFAQANHPQNLYYQTVG